MLLKIRIWGIISKSPRNLHYTTHYASIYMRWQHLCARSLESLVFLFVVLGAVSLLTYVMLRASMLWLYFWNKLRLRTILVKGWLRIKAKKSVGSVKGWKIGRMMTRLVVLWCLCDEAKNHDLKERESFLTSGPSHMCNRLMCFAERACWSVRPQTQDFFFSWSVGANIKLINIISFLQGMLHKTVDWRVCIRKCSF